MLRDGYYGQSKTAERWQGDGTLYNLLEKFVLADLIVETKVEGRKRSYIITEAGQQALADEVQRLKCLIHDYQKPII